MRKIISLSLGVALAATIIVAASASADPAIVVRDLGDCGVAGADSNGELIGGGLGTLTHVVQNDNYAVMTCKGDDIDNKSGRTQHFSGFMCRVTLPGGGSVLTEDSHATVTKKGKATMTCKVSFGTD